MPSRSMLARHSEVEWAEGGDSSELGLHHMSISQSEGISPSCINTIQSHSYSKQMSGAKSVICKRWYGKRER